MDHLPAELHEDIIDRLSWQIDVKQFVQLRRVSLVSSLLRTKRADSYFVAFPDLSSWPVGLGACFLRWQRYEKIPEQRRVIHPSLEIIIDSVIHELYQGPRQATGRTKASLELDVYAAIIRNRVLQDCMRRVVSKHHREPDERNMASLTYLSPEDVPERTTWSPLDMVTASAALGLNKEMRYYESLGEKQALSYLFGLPIEAASAGGHLNIVIDIYNQIGHELVVEKYFYSGFCASLIGGSRKTASWWHDLVPDKTFDYDHSVVLRSTLCVVCRQGDLYLLKLLISQAKLTPSKDMELLYIGLTRAAYRSHIEMIHYLVELGVQPAYNNWGDVALISAVLSGNLVTVQTLLDLGADVDQKDIDRWSAKGMAKKMGFSEILQLLEKSSMTSSEPLGTA
ncbi:hypothetical protein FH972_021160 [Carpinus fangiana]|uniref:Uncharacterized protein n=1 Tax=Carpinus fangiana TaxID=176857 RepID=A0A5N6KNI7_9ROSI|nr:hypothetical protein FH972_021160 [Carpinus fangiana]